MTARRASALLASAALAAPILAGCGGGGSNVDVGPAAIVPEHAPVYLDATVRPTGAAEADAKAAASKIFNTSDPGGKLVSLLEQSASQNGNPINYQQDIAPWLGKEVGVFFTTFASNPDGAAVAETTNPNTAIDFARKQEGVTGTSDIHTYNGVAFQVSTKDPTTVFGIVDDFLVEGSEAGFKAAVDASMGDSLGDSGDFKDSIGNLPSDRLGTVYTLPKDVLDAIPTEQFGGSTKEQIEKTAGDSLDQPVAGSLTASANSVDLQLTGGSNGVETPESSLIGQVPSGAWLALGIGNLGDNLKNSVDQLKSSGLPNIDQALSQIQSTTGASIDELTAALGDAVLYVQGTTQSTVGGALVIQSKNTELTGRLLDQLQGLLQLGSSGGGAKPLNLSGGGTGFQINDPNTAPQPVELAQQGDTLVIGYGPGSAQEALQPAQTLSSSSEFSSAESQVSSLGTDFFLSFPAVFQLAESGGANKDPGFQQAKPYLDALSYLVTGSGSKDDQAEVKAVLGLK